MKLVEGNCGAAGHLAPEVTEPFWGQRLPNRRWVGQMCDTPLSPWNSGPWNWKLGKPVSLICKAIVNWISTLQLKESWTQIDSWGAGNWGLEALRMLVRICFSTFFLLENDMKTTVTNFCSCSSGSSTETNLLREVWKSSLFDCI